MSIQVPERRSEQYQPAPAPAHQDRGELIAASDYRALVVDMGNGRRVSLTVFKTAGAASAARHMSGGANDIQWLAPNVRLSDTQD